MARRSWSMVGGLCGLVALSACGSGGGGASTTGAASGTTATAATTASAPVASAAKSAASAPAASGAPAASSPAVTETSEDEVNVEAMLKAGPGEGAGLIADKDVQLDTLDASNAPRLGIRTAVKPPADTKWLALPGDLRLPEPQDWKKNAKGDWRFLVSPDEKALLIFTPVKDKAEIAKKVNDVSTALSVEKIDWGKPKTIKLGKAGVPALLSGGKAMAKGKEFGLVFALVETGKPEKLLVVLAANKDAPDATMKRGIELLSSIDRADGAPGGSVCETFFAASQACIEKALAKVPDPATKAQVRKSMADAESQMREGLKSLAGPAGEKACQQALDSLRTIRPASEAVARSPAKGLRARRGARRRS